MPDGIPAEIVLRCPVLLIFQRKRRLIHQYRLSKAANCRLDFSVSLTVSSLPDQAEAPYQEGFSHRLTIEWGFDTVPQGEIRKLQRAFLVSRGHLVFAVWIGRWLEHGWAKEIQTW